MESYTSLSLLLSLVLNKQQQVLFSLQDKRALSGDSSDEDEQKKLALPTLQSMNLSATRKMQATAVLQDYVMDTELDRKLLQGIFAEVLD